MTPTSQPPAAPTPPPGPVHAYPRGEDDPAYKWAFTLWLVLFLGVICLGLLNYLALHLKPRLPWL